MEFAAKEKLEIVLSIRIFSNRHRRHDRTGYPQGVNNGLGERSRFLFVSAGDGGNVNGEEHNTNFLIGDGAGEEGIINERPD